MKWSIRDCLCCANRRRKTTFYGLLSDCLDAKASALAQGKNILRSALRKFGTNSESHKRWLGGNEDSRFEVRELLSVGIELRSSSLMRIPSFITVSSISHSGHIALPSHDRRFCVYTPPWLWPCCVVDGTDDQRPQQNLQQRCNTAVASACPMKQWV